MNISKPSQKKRAEKMHKKEKLTPDIVSHKFSSGSLKLCMSCGRYTIHSPSHYSALCDNPEEKNKKKIKHDQHEKMEE